MRFTRWPAMRANAIRLVIDQVREGGTQTRTQRRPRFRAQRVEGAVVARVVAGVAGAGSAATRKPRLGRRWSGARWAREAERQSAAGWSNAPPRMTRVTPWS